MTESIYFLGCRFDTGSLEEAVVIILAETDEGFKYVVTPNVHHLVKINDDPANMLPLYERAWRAFAPQQWPWVRTACAAL